MPSINDENTKSTAKIIDKMIDDNDDRIDEHEVLRARLLDMLVGDWDRHFDQFRWGTLDTGKGKLYYTIPRDRDQAYFYSDGCCNACSHLSNDALPARLYIVY